MIFINFCVEAFSVQLLDKIRVNILGSIPVFGDDQPIDIRSVAFLLRLQISLCLPPSPHCSLSTLECTKPSSHSTTLRPFYMRMMRPPAPSLILHLIWTCLSRHRRALTMSPVHRSTRCQIPFRLFSLLVLVFSRSVAHAELQA